MSTLSSYISTPTLTRLTELRDSLSQNGAVLLRKDKGRTPSYRLRVRAFIPDLGYRKMLAIVLRDKVEADAVKILIATWRAEHVGKIISQKLEEQAQKQAVRQQRLEEREEKLALQLLVPKNQRRRVLREYSQILQQGQIAATLYVLSKSYLKVPEKTPGKKKEAAAPAPTFTWNPVPVHEIVREKMRERREAIGLR